MLLVLYTVLVLFYLLPYTHREDGTLEAMRLLWLYLARGSGVYLNLGRTMVLPES